MRHLVALLTIIGSLGGPASAVRAEGQVLSLGEALRIARSQSPVLKKAAAESVAADARADGSRGRLLPQLLATGTWQHTTDNFVRRPGFSGGSGATGFVTDPPGITVMQIPAAKDPPWDFVNSYNFGLGASQLLYDFSSYYLYRADRERARAQVELERAALLSTEYAVRNAFFLARAQRELVSVADQTLANQEKHLAQIQAFVEVGTRPEIDLAQARTDVANARVQLLRAQNGYATAKENLKLVMGASTQLDYEVNDDSLAPLQEESEAAAELLRRAIQLRPELLALSRQRDAQSLRTRAAKGRLGPVFNLNGGINKAGIKGLDTLTTNAFVGATASWQLLQSGSGFAAIREESAVERSLEADLSALEQRIHVELTQARLTIEAAKAALTASQEALLNARARLGLAEGRYEAGVGNAIELGDAQLALTSADAQRVQSEYTLAIARAQLLAALGKSL
jgi:outer membrane protein